MAQELSSSDSPLYGARIVKRLNRRRARSIRGFSFEDWLWRAAQGYRPRRWDGPRFGRGPGPRNLISGRLVGRTTILRAQVARPGWTGPVCYSGMPKGAWRSQVPSRTRRTARRLARFSCRLRRASAQLLRERGRSRGSARARPPACAPWRRWRCAARGPSGRRRAGGTIGRARCRPGG